MALPNLRNGMCERFRDVNTPRSIFKYGICYSVRDAEVFIYGSPGCGHGMAPAMLDVP
jgi:hypothetical protein